MVNEKNGQKRGWRTLGKWLLALGLLVLVFALGNGGEVFRLSVNWLWAVGIFLSTLLFVLLHTLRWKKIVEILTKKKEGCFLLFYRWSLKSYLIGYVIPSDVSFFGTRTYYLNRYLRLSLPLSILSVTLDRVLDLAVLMVVIVPALLFAVKMLSAGGAIAFMVGLTAVFLLLCRWKRESVLRWMMKGYRWVLRLPFLRKRGMAALKESVEKDPGGGGDLYPVVAASVWKYFALGLRFHLTGLALGLDLSVSQTLLALPIMLTSGLVNVTPGGLGILEMGSWGALLLVGVPRGQILSFVVGQRILITLSIILLALFDSLYSLKGKPAFSSK